jgi:NitT/TauT family transport system ATP-binding protein
VIELDNVSLAYAGRTGPVLALEGASMSVKKGEFSAVVGPSGCGKSTLMKLVTGLVKPTTGLVSVNGSQVNGPVKLAGMAFQNSNLLPWRTVIDNLMLPLEIVEPYRSNFLSRKDEYRAKGERLLDTVGLTGFGDRFPWELSGGMQQRASLCRALIHEPMLVMLDEPFAALDAFTREELWCVLRDVWERLRFTVVLVTHDLREAAFLADTIHIMSARPGKIIETRHVDFARPRHLDVCYSSPFTDLVHTLRNKIAEVRQA